MEESKASHRHGPRSAGGGTSADEVWLSATWPFIRSQLPPPPARVIEIGCGQAGGHIPALVRAGYDATGVDPEAPEGPAYRQIAFEDYRPDGPAEAVIASVSLHHVDDPGAVLDQVADMLGPDGTDALAEQAAIDADQIRAGCLRYSGRRARPTGRDTARSAGPARPGPRSST